MKKLVRPRKRQFGQYYTPPFIAEFILENTLGKVIYDQKSSQINTVTILDPSVGQGVFLVEALKFLLQHRKEEPSDKIPDDIHKRIVVNHLFGFDIDSEQVHTTRKILGYPNFVTNVRQINALTPILESSYNKHRSMLYSTRTKYKIDFTENQLSYDEELDKKLTMLEKKAYVKPQLHESDNSIENKHTIDWNDFFPENQDKFSIIIGNPPWGVDLFEIANYRDYYTTSTPQIDSWVLFIERSLNSLKTGGYLGFVVPNTLLQNPNYTDIRGLILNTCQITHLVNLGEGIFPGVSQPSMIIIAKKTQFDSEFMINVIPKISRHQRNLLEEEKLSIGECDSFSCSQSRFINNPRLQFDIWAVPHSTLIDLIEGDLYTEKRTTVSFRTFVTNTRGVEIGRKGIIVKCDKCGYCNSPPKKKKKCVNPKCQNLIFPDSKRQNIVKSVPTNKKVDQPFLAGYQIQRYYTLKHLYIDSQCQGINYKSPTSYVGPKLLVRKTGSKMNWVIDYSNKWVSQVVYIFKLKENISEEYKSISLEYLLGLMNSDLMNFYVHSKFYEKERKDFPHLIQTSLLGLPIRVPRDPSGEEILTKIVNYVTKLQKSYQELFKKKGTQLKQEDLTATIEKLENNLNKLVNQIYKIPQDSRILKSC
jgi:type I restriction-modification system DNA methylase subunit